MVYSDHVLLVYTVDLVVMAKRGLTNTDALADCHRVPTACAT